VTNTISIFDRSCKVQPIWHEILAEFCLKTEAVKSEKFSFQLNRTIPGGVT